MELGVGFLIFGVLVFLGMSIYASLFVGALVITLLIGKSLSFFPVSAYFTLDKFLLLAIPLFILAGELMGRGGMSTRLVDLAYVLVGRIKGSLGYVVVLATLFFGALTGSTLATLSAIGSVMIPRMEKYGFDREYSTSLVICSSFLGLMIPPSIASIIYGFLANVSVAAMFLATVIPGLIVGVGYMVVNFFVAARFMRVTPAEGTAVAPAARLRDFPRTFFRAFPALLTPLIILGGIYGGIFTPTEAAAVAGIWALLAGFFIYRLLNLRGTYEAFLRAVISTSVIFAIMIFATPITRLLTIQGVVDAMISFMLGISDNPLVILFMVNILLLSLGMIIETLPILLIVVPLLLPLLSAVGVNPIHAGVILLLNLGIGTHSPPFGSSLFLGLRIGDVTFSRVWRHVVRFVIFVDIPVLLLTTLIPQFSLWLPTLVFGPAIAVRPVR